LLRLQISIWKNVKLYIAIISHAPDVKGLSLEKQERIIKKLQDELPQLRFIDCQKSLTSEDFYDPLHPNKKGAEKISAIIAEAVNADL
jgi:lysophospholipase L1-like esterase